MTSQTHLRGMVFRIAARSRIAVCIFVGSLALAAWYKVVPTLCSCKLELHGYGQS